METRGCWNCKKFEEHYYWNHLEETSLCFMKLMEGDFSLGMEFPNKFALKFRVDLPDLITLKVSNGDLWKICLFKEENHFYLKDGWKEFIVANGIEEYYSLFFKYAGNSTFTVKIFDQTGCFRDTTNFTRYNKNKAYEVYQTRRHRVDVAAPNFKRSRSSAFKIYHSSRLACYGYKPEQGIPNNNSSDGSFSDEVLSCKRKLREISKGGFSFNPKYLHFFAVSPLFGDQDVKPSQIWEGFDQKHINLYGCLKSKTKERRENSEDVFEKLKPFYANETADCSFVKVMMKSHIFGQSFMLIATPASSGGTPASDGSPAELRRQVAVRRNSGGGRGGVSFSSSLLLFSSSPLALGPFSRRMRALFIDFCEWHGS
ncbi:hypothetical protein M5K25_019603 [Dendrobium thyrsiflorum]|uniref:TF-B3 domain-containing protein n=1 Tax=Dendrobium thyrsiflorum TaxID=117978 RepID=A0ABD0UFG5_DENTH